MKFEYINLKQIRPFVRFTISNTQLLHTTYVVPLEHRLIYVEHGKADAWIDGKHYKMNKNDIIYISSGTPYKISSENDTIVFVVYFDLTMENSGYRERIKPIGISDEKNIPEYLTERYICKYRLKDKNKEIDFLYTKEKSIITLLLNEIKRYLNKIVTNEYCECVISGFMVSILAKMLDDTLTFEKRDSTDIVDLVLSYIHSRYNKNITLDDLALEFNFHKNYLNLRVKQATGLSIHKYLLKYRLSKAMDLFVYTNMSITEVAEKVGFKDSKAFSVAFKKRYSIAPSKVKKQTNFP